MKKYIQPQISTLKFNAESMLAASNFDIQINADQSVNQALSDGKDAWGSENWGADDEE